ncbi:MAG: HlyD family efflux transporter periplasmic adaptor subunit [Planctomycetota bacterium]
MIHRQSHLDSTLLQHSRQYAALIVAALLSLATPTAVGQEALQSVMTFETLDRVTISARQDGFVVDNPYKVGDSFRQNELLVQLGTERLTLELQAAVAESEALRIQSENRAAEKNAISREQVARFQMKKYEEIESSISPSQMRDRKFSIVPELERARVEADLEQAVADREGALKDRQQAKFDSQAKKLQADVLRFDIQSSSANAPFAGVVAKQFKSEGSFVQRGDGLLEIYRMDVLQGVVLFRVADLPPGQAIGTALEIQVADTKGRQVNLVSHVVRVAPSVETDDRYVAYLEIKNQFRDGRWAFLPGMAGTAKPAISDPQNRERTVLNW